MYRNYHNALTTALFLAVVLLFHMKNFSSVESKFCNALSVRQKFTLTQVVMS
ncbi:MAG: hypothetical protein CMIDDMOC_00506 [Sodalis sp. Fle]|nr:MAG: hypothetical protein CMIDDMOC_00506 [Sodalis sp. Fle]